MRIKVLCNLTEWIAFSIASTFCCQSASADILVYDNGAGDASTVNRYLRSDDANLSILAADDVVLPSTTRITRIEWSGLYQTDDPSQPEGNPPNDNFTIAFFLDNGGSPMDEPPVASFNVADSVNRVDSGIDTSTDPAFSIFEYSANIDFTMNSDTRYWISIINDTPNDPEAFFWAGVIGSGNAHRSFFGGPWLLVGGTMDFKLYSPIFTLGDANNDGEFNNLDIAAFVLALTDAKLYTVLFPKVDPDEQLDMNGDGVFNNFDIAGFVAALTGG